jgi:hypothetical protein
MHTVATAFAAVLVFALGAWLARHAFSALRSGVAHASGGREYRRKKKPVMYWLTLLGDSLRREAFEMKEEPIGRCRHRVAALRLRTPPSRCPTLQADESLSIVSGKPKRRKVLRDDQSEYRFEVFS